MNCCVQGFWYYRASSFRLTCNYCSCSKGKRLAKIKSEMFDMLYLRSYSVGDFTLASGKKSNYYFDCRRTLMNNSFANRLGVTIAAMTQHLTSLKAIGGPESAALPIATAACMYYKFPMEGFYVRKEPKKHGSKKQIEGMVQEGDEVVIVDDVSTTGESILKAINVVEAEGAKVRQVITIIDRNEGAYDLLEAYNFVSIFNISDFNVKT